ncbi:hypothetical protein MVEN_01415500 [Mycena venus]|uniref:Uncharacterized protein n=1 Tax=Mycena venus TaxID=2733690 RepID=A0A8H6XZ06_9AGAR|nr:hypothetical protein MVEN_01415500 [Mycena venus]
MKRCQAQYCIDFVLVNLTRGCKVCVYAANSAGLDTPLILPLNYADKKDINLISSNTIADVSISHFPFDVYPGYSGSLVMHPLVITNVTDNSTVAWDAGFDVTSIHIAAHRRSKARNAESTVLRTSWALPMVGDMPGRWSRGGEGGDDASNKSRVRDPHPRASIVGSAPHASYSPGSSSSTAKTRLELGTKDVPPDAGSARDDR